MLLDIQNIILSMRPKQWVKNFFIFAALIFVYEFTNIDKILLTVSAFVIFCLVSSATYLINDIIDLPSDRKHPAKKFRPIASGKVSSTLALFLSIILLIFALWWAVELNKWFSLVVIAYFLLNLLYSLFLKRVVILDVIVIALGFVLRVIAGAVIINVAFSPWLVFCTFFLTLFLATGKRKGELMCYNTEETRQVLSQYSLPLVDQINMVVLPLTLMTYTLYTFNSEHSRLLMVTVPIVLYGLLRYLFILNTKKINDNGPADDFFSDNGLKGAVFLWLVVVFFVLLYAK